MAPLPPTTRANSSKTPARRDARPHRRLVRSAIGFEEKRGDQVEVVNLRFAETPPVPVLAADPGGLMTLLQFTKDDMMRGIELGVMMLLGWS